MMQRIYSDGTVRLAELIPANWEKPAKIMNHRCPKRVIRLINRVRGAIDTHEQVARSDKPEGTVRLFVLPNTMLNVSSNEFDIAKQMAIAADDSDWISENGGYKTLILEHQMAARRMGFEAMFTPLYKSSRLKTSLIDGDLAGLRLFGDEVLPLITAVRRADSFEVAEIVRRRSPLLNEKLLASLGTDQLMQLAKAKAAVDALMHLWDGGSTPTFQDVLNSVSETKLFMIPDALLGFTDDKHNLPGVVVEALVEYESNLTEQERELTAWREFLATPFDQISAYVQYVTGTSRFETHQGVKGLEFPRVMVIISDDEARGFLFSYEKLFGAKEKSSTDIKHESTGEETTIDRTRRLFYVTCSRAESSLAIVAYSQNPAAVQRQVLQEGWFDEPEVVCL